jgi:alpha-L-fucosidase 2
LLTAAVSLASGISSDAGAYVVQGELGVPAAVDGGVEGSSRHHLVFDRPAEDSHVGWENESLPIGCGWFGASVFGGVTSERIEFTDNTLLVGGNRNGLGHSSGNRGMGLTSAGRLRIDFAHEDVSGYSRSLELDSALAKIAYDSKGVRYTREFFASYPAKSLVGRLTASKPGALTFKLRFETYGFDRTAEIRASGQALDVDQRFGRFGIRHALSIRVNTDGTVVAEGGALKVSGATRAEVYVAGKSNYRLEPRVFLEPDPLKKLAGNPDPRPEAERICAAAAAVSASSPSIVNSIPFNFCITFSIIASTV